MLGEPIEPIVMCEGRMRVPLFDADGNWVKNAVVNGHNPDLRIEFTEEKGTVNERYRIFHQMRGRCLTKDLKRFEDFYYYVEGQGK